MGRQVMIRNARLAFPTLWEPKQINGKGDPKFSATLLIPPDHPQFPDLKAACIDAAKEKWGEKEYAAVLAALKHKDKLPYHDGNMKTPQPAGYAGMYYINANNKVRPTVIDRNRAPLAATDGRPYAGCYVNAMIEVYGHWHEDGGNCLPATLLGIQFAADGEAFGSGGVVDASAFEDLSDGAGAEGLVGAGADMEGIL